MVYVFFKIVANLFTILLQEIISENCKCLLILSKITHIILKSIRGDFDE